MRMNFDDKWYRSMWQMAKQYEKIAAPLRKQTEVFEKFYSEIKPMLPEIEMNRNILSCNNIVDSAMSKVIAGITQPSQSLVDNISAVNDMLATQFSKYVQPQVYVPDMSYILGMVEKVRPWKHELAVIASYDISVLREQSEFGHLVEMEKAVAGLSKVEDYIQEMTSVSAQLASLSQLGLTDQWKDVIIPSDLFENLSGFTVRQYEKIQKAVDASEISWRLGLVDVASKYVDSQVSWWSALAVESGQDAPESAAITPDFSELPVLLANSKRDGKDVEEAYDNSNFSFITGMGRKIIENAQKINQCCQEGNCDLLFSEKNLVEWSLTLAGSYCRDNDALNNVMSVLYAMFIRQPIIDTIGWPECFDDIEKYKTESEDIKSKITKIQRRTYNSVIIIENNILDYFNNNSSSSHPLNENKITGNIMKTLVNVRENKEYEGKNENVINDGIRDQLRMVYEVRDQSRQGSSVSGKDAGEIDLMICDKGEPYAIIEGMVLDSLDKKALDTHIKKVLTNYDPLGCPITYVLIYARMERFDDFWDRLTEYVKKYSFPYDVVEDFTDMPFAYAESRHGKIVLKRSGKNISFHLFAIKLR